MTDDFHLMRKVTRVSNLATNLRVARLRRLELTRTQSEVILFVHGHPGVNISSLKDHLGVSHQAAQALVTRMRQKGILQTEVSSTDSRCVTIKLTQLGEETHEEILKDGADAGSSVTAGMTSVEKGTLETLLDKLLSNLEEPKD